MPLSPHDPIGPLSSLAGVGPARVERLARLGVESLADLMFLAPRGVLLWPQPVGVAEARALEGEVVSVHGKVKSSRLTRLGGKRSLVRITLEDESGTIDGMFFNQAWMREAVTVGDEVDLNGRIVDVKGSPTLASPKIGTQKKPLPPPGSVVPLYPVTDGVSQDFMHALCRDAAERFEDRVREPLPDHVLAQYDLPSLGRAVRAAHMPRSLPEFTGARRRLAFEPLLAAQANIHARRGGAGARARRVEISDALHAELIARFPFELTRGQAQVLRELRQDLGRGAPMRRLLQGDVGSGKTVIALYAAMAVAECGGQAAFMAPTELLAEQHFDGLRKILSDAGIDAALLTGSLKGQERRGLLNSLENGSVQVVFGTHALFSKDVHYTRLDLAIIDEQHRFGVGQRGALTQKGVGVHTFLMTATPIPRTLALTIYGDLEVSLLKEMPPGRGEIRTRWLRAKDKARVFEFLNERLAEGEQVYWVCPRIGSAEDDADSKTASAERRYEEFLETPLARFGIELVHGRVPAEERAFRLDRFRRGEVGMLVATTVIEVGVDVASATAMVIENAERLGLAQLHQLRGRVGRGPLLSWCLIDGKKTASERFELLERSRDGFELAEEDLRQRGMGDLAGVRQSGVNGEGLEDFDGDLDLLMAARDVARSMPELATHYAAVDTNPTTP